MGTGHSPQREIQRTCSRFSRDGIGNQKYWKKDTKGRGCRGGKLVQERKKRQDKRSIGIINLSGHNLTQGQIGVLSKGLKYVPKQQGDTFNTFVDLQKFKRKLCLKRFFAKKPLERIITSTNQYVHTTLKEKSQFYPRYMISKEIDTFDQMIQRDIRKLEKNTRHTKPSNLTKEEYEGLKQIKRDTNLIIKPADKGGGVVILNKEQYHQETCRLLNDPVTYKKLGGNPTESIKQKFYEYLQRGKDIGVINDDEYRYLKINYPRIPVLYHLPKVHKDINHPPGRPIVSGINSISCRISEHIDHLLQPLVQKTSAYLKDTITTLQIIRDIKWEPGYLLATCDVNSLYTIIPHDIGCKAVEFFLTDSGNFRVEQIQYILEGIKLILHNNFFWYGGEYYLQCNGTAMGTRFAPSYANLFMAHWENGAVWTGHSWGPNLVLYKRYIDDILIIWKGERSELERFLGHLNHNDIGIKLDTNISTVQVNFLDLDIYIYREWDDKNKNIL
uniref:Reverse transcriptase domain-containing protein n=1 Tax=Leptobrachium leishanense TaxID=445787 RepID=A0A8C5M9D4_9ANUR